MFLSHLIVTVLSLALFLSVANAYDRLFIGDFKSLDKAENVNSADKEKATRGNKQSKLRLEDEYRSGQWIRTLLPIAKWRGISSDSTGKYLATAYEGGGIYINDNYGSGSWTLTSAPSAHWYSIASDSTGQYLFAVAHGGSIYTNSNYGLGSWTQTASPEGRWGPIASDVTGKYLAVTVFESGIYTNHNYGAGAWTVTLAPNAFWYDIASDSTGRYLAAVVNGGGIYTNQNYGSGNWFLTAAPPNGWHGIASDSTGRYLAACAAFSGIYINNNYGSESWTLTSAPIAYWWGITSDSTGRYLAAIFWSGGGIYTNNNYGSGSWTQTSAPGGDWTRIVSDSTGEYLAAVVYNGYVYTNGPARPTAEPTQHPTSPNNGCPPPSIKYLVVAGGGGGACYCGGGGGGFLEGSLAIDPNGTVLEVVVGQGGTDGSCGGGGESGYNSKLGSITAIGGGKAAHCQNCNGYSGGSGGGAYNHQAGYGAPGQGHDGAGCNGGGAGTAATTTGGPPGNQGKGGDGAPSNITGSVVYYSGGVGGGGDDVFRSGLGYDGPGGGGVRYGGANPGIVVISYPNIYSLPSSLTANISPTVLNKDGNIIIIFQCCGLVSNDPSWNQRGFQVNGFIRFSPCSTTAPSAEPTAEPTMPTTRPTTMPTRIPSTMPSTMPTSDDGSGRACPSNSYLSAGDTVGHSAGNCVCKRGFTPSLHAPAHCSPCPYGESTVYDGSSECVPTHSVKVLSEKKCPGYRSIRKLLPSGSVSVKYIPTSEEKMLIFTGVTDRFYDAVSTVEARFVSSYHKENVDGRRFPGVLTKKDDSVEQRFLLAVPPYSGKTYFHLSFPSCVEHLLKPGQHISKLRLKFYSVQPEAMLTADKIVGCKDYHLDPDSASAFNVSAGVCTADPHKFSL